MAQEESRLTTARNSAAEASRVGSDIGERVLGERPTMEHVLLLLFFVVGVYMYVEANEFAPAAQQFPQLMAGTTALLSFLLLTRNYLHVIGPIVALALGVYFAYEGGTAYLDDGSGLVQTIGGLILVFASVVYRGRVGTAIRTFVAEPMQLGGDMDPMEDIDETDKDESSVAEAEDTDIGDAATAESASVPAADAEEADDEGSTEALYVYDIDDWRGPVVTGALSIVYMLLTYTIGMLYATPIFVAAWTVWAKMDVVRAVGLILLSFVSAYFFYEIISDDIAQGWLTGWEPAPPDELYDILVDFIGLAAYVPDLLGLGAYVPDLLQWMVMLL